MDPRQRNVLDFWFRELTPQDWFNTGEKLDPVVRDRFGALHQSAVNGRLDRWADTPLGRLALILVLDQFSRHIHRGELQSFAADTRAQKLAVDGIREGMDERLALSERQFFYMPLMHAEDADLQKLSIERFTALKDDADYILKFALAHQDEISRFGRFPFRNEALARVSSDDETRFMDDQPA